MTAAHAGSSVLLQQVALLDGMWFSGRHTLAGSVLEARVCFRGIQQTTRGSMSHSYFCKIPTGRSSETSGCDVSLTAWISQALPRRAQNGAPSPGLPPITPNLKSRQHFWGEDPQRFEDVGRYDSAEYAPHLFKLIHMYIHTHILIYLLTYASPVIHACMRFHMRTHTHILR